MFVMFMCTHVEMFQLWCDVMSAIYSFIVDREFTVAVPKENSGWTSSTVPDEEVKILQNNFHIRACMVLLYVLGCSPQLVIQSEARSLHLFRERRSAWGTKPPGCSES